MPIAEQEQDMQTVYKWYLGVQAIKVMTVGSGQECCEKAAGEDFDIIIVDKHLKDVEGREVVRRILQARPENRVHHHARPGLFAVAPWRPAGQQRPPEWSSPLTLCSR